MKQLLAGLRVILNIVGGVCLAIAAVMAFGECTGGQVRGSDEQYHYLWFIGLIAGGLICMVVAGLLSDKLKDFP